MTPLVCYACPAMSEESRSLQIVWNSGSADRILSLARAGPGGPIRVIRVTGPVGAGKSTIAAALSSVAIRTDDYLPDYDRVPVEERELPESSDLGRLVADLDELRAGLSVSVPVWSFRTHRREGERLVQPSSVVVVEGIHAFEVADGEIPDIRVYVDAPVRTRWARWERIEEAGERGWGVERAREYFNTVAEPAFSARAAQMRAMADVIVENG